MGGAAVSPTRLSLTDSLGQAPPGAWGGASPISAPITQGDAAPFPRPLPQRPPALLQTFLFYLYGLLLRESACVELVRKHLAGLLELSHQRSSQREVGWRPGAPAPAGLAASLRSSISAGATGAGADLQ